MAAVPALILEGKRLYEAALAEEKLSRGVGASEAERAAEAERRRNKALAEARAAEVDDAWRRRLERKARALDFDRKQGGQYYNRSVSIDLSKIDLDEESPIGPMRFTHREYGSRKLYLSEGLNILSVKIASSDVGFPIRVYGRVIARDCVDRKCLYLFRRDKHHSQLINSEDDSLILTGPKRGIPLGDDDYVEIDLKIKDDQGQDRELSKGYLTIRHFGPSSENCTVESKSLATRLSTVDVVYAVASRAVEATIAIEILQGDFFGEITAYTTSMTNRIVLYDSKLSGVVTCDGKGVIKLTRPAISVCLHDLLILSIVDARAGDGRSDRTIDFTPRVNHWDEDKITVGATKMHVKVVWSLMD